MNVEIMLLNVEKYFEITYGIINVQVLSVITDTWIH